MQETFINGYRGLKDKLWIKSTIAKNVGIDNEKILFTQHHISHAAVAYYTSPFKSAAILTVMESVNGQRLLGERE